MRIPYASIMVALACQISSSMVQTTWPASRLRVDLKARGAKGDIEHGLLEVTPSHQHDDHLYSVQVKNQDIYADVDGSLVPFIFGVAGSRTSLDFERDMGGGLFVNLTFPRSSSQHDTLIGRLPGISNIMCHSRIKRWWMAPFFPENVDAVPIETQLLLLETPVGIPTTMDLQVGLLRPANVSVQKAPPGMMYSVIMPLVDYTTGFRTTLFGWNEGGPPAGDGVLVARSESGDEVVTSSKVSNALFIAAGKDPYKLLNYAFRSVSEKMGTFKVRTEKPPIPGFDGFGYCTWDAFYSSVDSDKIESAVTSLHNIGVPPKFVIIDDGWQSTANMGDKRESAEKVKDGELSGAQIDGSLAADRLVKENYDGNVISKSLAKVVGCATKLVTQFYTEVVEKAPPDDWSVKIWTLISQTVIKDVLIDFFASQTDFSKRLTSWKANIKFEDVGTGKTFKQFITRLKSDMGVEKVFVWHALGGYWGGISTESMDDFPKEFARNAEMGNSNSVIGQLFKNEKESILSGAHQVPIRDAYPKPTPHLLMIEPALAWDPSSLSGVGRGELETLPTIFRLMHSYLKDAGVDGVKVDAQSGIGALGSGLGGGSIFARAAVQAVELSVKSAFGKNLNVQIDRITKLPSWLQYKTKSKSTQIFDNHQTTEAPMSKDAVPLIACMCHSTENLFSYMETPSARASDDFYPKDMASQTVHIVSCAYNSVFLSEIASPDWDMFHSQHEFAEMHAAGRAISGGPVYVSDYPGNHNEQLLKRLVMPTGRILRTSTPARPTIDCLFKNVMQDGVSSLKLWSRNVGGGGVVAAFNVQGSHWSRKDRKYVSDLIKPPFVATSIKPADCGEDFLSFSQKIHGNGQFIAWLSNSKTLITLYSDEDGVELFLRQKDWEIATIHPILEVSQTFDYAVNNIERETWAEWFKRKFSGKKKKDDNLDLQIALDEIEQLRAQNDMYRDEIRSLRNKLQNRSFSQRKENIFSFSSNFNSPTVSDVIPVGSNNNTRSSVIIPKVKGQRRRDMVIPIAATLGYALARGRGWGTAATISSTIAGYVAAMWSKRIAPAHNDIRNNIRVLQWAPIGLLDMLNPGGAITFLPSTNINAAGEASFYAHGEGRFGFFSSIPPTRVVVDGVETSVQYDNMTMIACFNLEAPKKLPVIERLEAVGAFTFSFGDEQRKIDIIWHST